MSRIYRVIAMAAFISLLTGVGPALSQGGFEWPEQAENLKVLPKDTPAKRLRAIMRGFSTSLGVRCNHCHVGEAGQPLSTFDFPSDDNSKKDVARAMLTMLGDINTHLEGIEPSGPERVNMWCHTCHNGVPRPMTLVEALGEVYEHEGGDAAVSRYQELRERYYGRGAYDFGELSLNQLGYRILGSGDHATAIRVFEINLANFPDSWNAYDSLADAHLSAGHETEAIGFYEKSLTLNPKNRNAAARLEELRAKDE